MPPAPAQRRLLERVDHLVYAAPDLDAAVGALAETLGVRAEPGGRHPREATRNFLIALGPASYLEIVGPDSEAAAPVRPRWFGIDGLQQSRLVAWAARGEGLEAIVSTAARQGLALGPVASAHRETADGRTLSWRFTDPRTVLEGGVVPFLIDWGATPHPAATAPAGCRLLGLRAEHPEPQRALEVLALLGLAPSVTPGPTPALIALLETPRGAVELR